MTCGLLVPLSLAAGEWPQFRGPGGQGHAETQSMPLSFGKTENVRWATDLPGTGWSSPVVLEGQVWMTTAVDNGKSLRVLGVDLETGKLLHNVEVFAPQIPVPINPTNSFASPTPVVEPGRVYVSFGAMGMACLSTQTGEVLWRNEELKIDHMEGPGSSPILFENLVILNCDGMDQQYVVALDTETGKPVWKTDRSAPFRDNPDHRKAYSTPLVIDVGGELQLVSIGADQVQGYDPRTGRELWQVRFRGFSCVPRPLYDGGLLYSVVDYGRPELLALRTGGRGDVTESHIAWKFNRQVPASPSPILVDGRIYMTSNKGVVSCIDGTTGDTVWQERLGGNYSASPVYAAGRLYFASQEGKIAVFEPGSEFRLLAENDLDEKIMASPAVVDGSLIVRTATKLYRFEGAKSTE